MIAVCVQYCTTWGRAQSRLHHAVDSVAPSMPFFLVFFLFFFVLTFSPLVALLVLSLFFVVTASLYTWPFLCFYVDKLPPEHASFFSFFIASCVLTVSPYQDLEKATVLQECRVFSDSNVVTTHPRRCGLLITKLLYILTQGETLSSSETTEVHIISYHIISYHIIS